jgi:hypothetical protein
MILLSNSTPSNTVNRLKSNLIRKTNYLWIFCEDYLEIFCDMSKFNYRFLYCKSLRMEFTKSGIDMSPYFNLLNIDGVISHEGDVY